MNKLSKFFFLITALWLTLFLVGCTTNWVSEAVSIINVLIPAVTGILGIVSTLGAKLNPSVLTSIQKWGQEATNDLQNVILPLINQYNAAEAAAQPGLLTEIETAMATIVNNLNVILPTLHITDPQTQAKVDAVVTAVQSEMTALLNLIPVVKGAVTSHKEAKARFAALRTADEFKAQFNQAASAFGGQFTIK